MKRLKLGDILAFQTDRGYRIFHWAYNVPKKGKYIRVMPGFYQTIPNNLNEIVSGECAFIIWADINWYYKNGLFVLVGHEDVSNETYPFPEYQILLKYVDPDDDHYAFFEFNHIYRNEWETCRSDPFANGFPERFKYLKLLNLRCSPFLMMTLLSSDFDTHNWHKFDMSSKKDYYEKLYGHLLKQDL